ncbi:hypothetical protein D3C78_1960200 [compost metagenome]
MNEEVDQAEQDDLAVLEQLAHRWPDWRRGFAGLLFSIDGVDQCILFGAGQPFRVVGFGVEPEPDEHA